jgi:glycosyltransferase involved in cell wall biosynthesis
VGSEPDDRKLARWFQAADAYVHPARADTFPLVNLEAQACGAAVIATAVDGIPEQLVHVDPAAVLSGMIAAGATGTLTAAGHAGAMVAALDAIAECAPETRIRLSAQAAAHARLRFDRARHAREYESWLRELAARPESGSGVRGAAADRPPRG